MFAISTAVFAPKDGRCGSEISEQLRVAEGVHLASALLVFLVLIIFVLSFTCSDTPKQEWDWRKRARNWTYSSCMVGMCACIVGIFVVFTLDAHELRLVLILEWVALWLFGISWLIKGQTLLARRPRLGRR